ncbi:MAG: coproporphyrinogen III oxidase [Sulfurovum sp. AS07-7]|nr:MAG: coproporphyrinogen III oxidase [Sulfurovum sp. AS07-7]
MLLYIHIPYCDSKCHYCSFNSYVDKFDTRADYMDALMVQLEYELERFKVLENSIKSIFIGGGTPSTIHPKLYAPLFKKLQPYLQKELEITSEANPNSASIEWLKGMFELGVNRISFGVQSFDNDKLKALNRTHSSRTAKEAIENAFNIGFKNLSLDLIYNYQTDSKELMLKDIIQAFELPINHISAYELTIEEHTKFFNQPQKAKADEELAFFVADEITSRGFAHYEISNFGDYQSYHNKGYWKLKDYIGLGAGAVGFLKDKRFYPSKDILDYILNPLNIFIEEINSDELQTEKIFLGLRSVVGIDELILDEGMRKRADFLVQNKKLKKVEKRYINDNFFLADELALYLLG